MVSEKKLNEWFLEMKPKYDKLTHYVQNTIKESLYTESVKVFEISSRTKELKSFLDKVKNRKKYSNPKSENTDFSGIRIISYLEKDTIQISDIIHKLFKVNEALSVIKKPNSKYEEHDKVGYASIHLICELGNDRKNLLENSDIKDLQFEIQIRSILQHAWAEIEHDYRYKFPEFLPPEINRKFSLLSASLELLDEDFNQLRETIEDFNINPEKYGISISDDEELNEYNYTLILKLILQKGFTFVKLSPCPKNVIIESICDFKALGIKTIGSLKKFIDGDFKINYMKINFFKKRNSQDDIYGFIILILMYLDINYFFTKSQLNKFNGISEAEYKVLELKYGADLRNILNKYEIDILPNSFFYE